MKVLAHGDTDGLTSAVLACMAFGVSEESVRFSRPTELLRDLKGTEEDTVILDIALMTGEAGEILQEMERISGNHDLLYIDHHPLPRGIMESGMTSVYHHDTERSTAELTYDYLREKLPREAVQTALYGAIADYNDDTVWVRDELERWDKRVIYFQAGVLLQALGEARHKYDLKRSIIGGMLDGKLPSEMDRVVELARKESEHDKNLYNYLKEHHEREGKIAYAIVERGSLAKGAHLVMGIADSEVGIVGKAHGGRVDMSLRASKSFEFDLAELAREITDDLGGSAGGHAAAAGAQVPSKKMDEFITRMAEELG